MSATLDTASGAELDALGAAYGLAREKGETDNAFREHARGAMRRARDPKPAQRRGCSYCGDVGHVRHCACGRAARPSSSTCGAVECMDVTVFSLARAYAPEGT